MGDWITLNYRKRVMRGQLRDCRRNGAYCGGRKEEGKRKEMEE
jgi:hypothetical protein